MLDILSYKAWAIDKSFLDRVVPLVYTRLANGQSLDTLVNKQTKIDEQMAATYSMRMGVQVEYDRKTGLLTTTSDAKHTIGILPIIGSLTKRGDLCSYGMRDYEGMIQRMNESENIAGLVIELDSPGGTADGTPELAKVIADSQKPIITFGDTWVASAAMWIASQSDFIFANANNPTEFGSIGTLYMNENWGKFIEDKIGSVEIIRAPQSVDKARLNVIEEMPDDVRAELIEELRDLTNDFVTSVAKGLGLKASKGKEGRRIIVSPSDEDQGEPENITTGRMYKAQRALQLGLIHGIGTFMDAVNKASELVNTRSSNPSSSATSSENSPLSGEMPEGQRGSNSNNSNMKISKWLGFSQETEEKLSAEEKQSLASADEKLTRLESENTLLKEQVQQKDELIGELKIGAKDKDQQIADLTAKLEAEPAEDTPVTTEGQDPNPDPNQENQAKIDSLPHNKELDDNPMFAGSEKEPKSISNPK